MEKLYCTHCDKTYSVRPEDIRLMLAHQKPVLRDKEGYRFEDGCFFKVLTALKRR